WADEDGEILKAYQAVPSDKTVHAEYISVEEAAKPEALYLQNYEVWVSLEEETYHPYYTVVPKDAIDKSVRWSVSDPEIADADEEGNILLKGIGTVTVTGTTSNGKCASFILHIEKEVDYQDVTGITPEASSIILHPGEYAQVRILQTPQNVPVSGELSYESDNDEVAAVDENGVIFAVSPGTCVIRVQNSESDITAEYSVTVTEKEEEAGPDDPGMQEDPEKQDDPGKQPTTISPTPKGQKTQQQTTGRQTRDQKATQQQTTDQKATQPYSNGKDTGSSTKSNAVNTGDNSKPFVWLLFIVCSVVIMRRIGRRNY
ncbi:MAG: Ig-like domain-containing protein, partial [Lachnospiraceae bacterium]|nr:Ig-like domain-containing protein [Lachnospiraceae bacterium]